MRIANERREILVRTEARIDPLVVGGVVLVVRGGREDRREVQTADAEVGEPAEVLADAGDVAAEERLHGRRLTPRPLPGRIVHLVAVGESVGKDQVERPPGDPGRHSEAIDG